CGDGQMMQDQEKLLSLTALPALRSRHGLKRTAAIPSGCRGRCVAAAWGTSSGGRRQHERRGLMRTWHRWWPTAVAAGVLVFALANPFRADEKDEDKEAKDTDLDKKLGAVVKAVINRGADMHNRYRDTAGCYHYYRGSLETLRAVLDH